MTAHSPQCAACRSPAHVPASMVGRVAARPAGCRGPSHPETWCFPGRGRCASIFLDKNGRHIGKSQSKRPTKRTQRPPHRHALLQRPHAHREVRGGAHAERLDHAVQPQQQPLGTREDLAHDVGAAGPHLLPATNGRSAGCVCQLRERAGRVCRLSGGANRLAHSHASERSICASTRVKVTGMRWPIASSARSPWFWTSGAPAHSYTA
jgi:hypothetical protein